MSYGLGAYKKTSVQTASKEQILLMLYQAAIKNCKKAMEGIETNDVRKKGEHIGKEKELSEEANVVAELWKKRDFATIQTMINKHLVDGGEKKRKIGS